MILKEKRERYECIYGYNGLGILNEVKVHEKMKEKLQKKNKKKKRKKERNIKNSNDDNFLQLQFV